MIDAILEALKDGKWYEFDALCSTTNMSRRKLYFAINFLAQFDFVARNVSHGRYGVAIEEAKADPVGSPVP